MAAPGLLTTITGWPSRCCSSDAVSRAATSVTEPTEIGTIILIGRSGNVSAPAIEDSATKATNASKNFFTGFSSFSLISVFLSFISVSFPDAAQHESGAPLFPDRPKLRACNGPGSAAHHCAPLHAALRPGNGVYILGVANNHLADRT